MRQEADGEPVKLLRSLEDARVTTLPPAAYYIPNFITAEDEALLLNRVRVPRIPDHVVTYHRTRMSIDSPSID